MATLHTQQLNTTPQTTMKKQFRAPHPNIPPHFAHKARRNNQKAPASPLHHKGRRCIPRGGTVMVNTKGRQTSHP